MLKIETAALGHYIDIYALGTYFDIKRVKLLYCKSSFTMFCQAT